jgi:hypothetical protein
MRFAAIRRWSVQIREIRCSNSLVLPTSSQNIGFGSRISIHLAETNNNDGSSRANSH